jgi:hypothetical protein
MVCGRAFSIRGQADGAQHFSRKFQPSAQVVRHRRGSADIRIDVGSRLRGRKRGFVLASGAVQQPEGEAQLDRHRPWAVAFSFGLLHGLGFANALIDIGLPQGDIPLALIAFNIGVEVGQLAFIAAVVGVIQLAKQFRIPDIVECRLPTFTAYGVGVVAAFWFVERLGGFWA